MPESFGARLRQQRERQNIALTSIADRTKISLSLLERLERDDVSHWPAGIFRRSFIRAYAQLISRDPEAIVREFLELYPDPAAGADTESVSSRPPTRLRCLVAAAIRPLSRFHAEDVQKQGHTTEEMAAAKPPSPLVTLPPEPKPEPQREPEPDLSAVAQICTELSQVLETRNVAPLLGRAAGILDAVGLIVWAWDSKAAALTPAFAHGYPDEVLAKLPKVRRDTANATAASFRSAQTQIVNGSRFHNGAVVVPLLAPAECVGVLAIELRHGAEQKESVRALATILAAQLATCVASAPVAEAVSA